MINDIKNILVSEAEIEEITTRLANEITRDYKDSNRELVLVCILKGSLMFMTELMKKINLPLQIEFMKVSSYGSGSVSTGKLNIQLDLNIDNAENVDLLIVEDIIDSGNTLSKLVSILKERNFASVKTCTLLDKPERRTVDFDPDYVGTIVPDEFVVGFGLDYAEKYRNLPYVGVLKSSVYN